MKLINFPLPLSFSTHGVINYLQVTETAAAVLAERDVSPNVISRGLLCSASRDIVEAVKEVEERLMKSSEFSEKVPVK